MGKNVVKNVVKKISKDLKKEKIKSLTKPLEGLCFRCEWRALFLESGHGPRYECQQVDNCVHSCYMYGPVRPIVLRKNEDDPREMFAGALFSARSHFVKVGDCELRVKHFEYGAMPYWAPKVEESYSAKQPTEDKKVKVKAKRKVAK